VLLPLDSRLGRNVALASVYNLLHRHGWSKIAPDKRHPKTDAAAQENWQKTPPTPHAKRLRVVREGHFAEGEPRQGRLTLRRATVQAFWATALLLKLPFCFVKNSSLVDFPGFVGVKIKITRQSVAFWLRRTPYNPVYRQYDKQNCPPEHTTISVVYIEDVQNRERKLLSDHARGRPCPGFPRRARFCSGRCDDRSFPIDRGLPGRPPPFFPARK